MLLLNQKKNHMQKVHLSRRLKQSDSPQIKSWKIAYRETRRNKLLNMFQDIAKQNQSMKQQPKYEIQPNFTEPIGKSSYQIYKQKQKQQKIKLQDVHTFMRPKPSIQKFCCTLRIRQGSPQKKAKKDAKGMNRTLDLGSLCTIRSQIHDREQAKRQFIKTPRECLTRNSNRKFIIPRKYSLDNPMGPLKYKLIHRNISFDNQNFNIACRPWSPADAIQNAFITEGQLHLP